MGYLEIAMVIQGQVGYETPIQWRIAAELEQRELMALESQPVKEDVEARRQLGELQKSTDIIAKGIEKLPRWMPVSRKTMVYLYNGAMGFDTPAPAEKWWRFKYTIADHHFERLLVVAASCAGLMFIVQILVNWLSK